jgi:hypothetical protein
VTSGPETVFQQSTYQPDSTWRWMGSAAMDHNGNIALGFSASSGAIHPELRYAGRLSTDPLNTLAQGEATLISGPGSQTGTSNRWGDYADMTVDPVDDCTFWFTSEYYTVTTQFSWHTRIGSFTMPGCGSTQTTGGIAGHVTDSVSHAALAGATVAIQGGASTTTDGAGAYSFSNLAAQSYSVTASAAGHTTSAPANVTVTAGNTTTQDFALVPTTGSISGHVTNAAGGAPISGATVSIQGGGSTATDANGLYTFSGLAPASYTLTASKTGFVTSSPVNVSVSAGNTTTQNFALTAVGTQATGYFYVASSLAGTGGDGNGYETARTSLVGAPNGSTIVGIQVQLVAKANSNKNTPKLCVQLSWDGGVTWTTGKTTANLTTAGVTYTLGSASDTWAHTWTAGQLATSSFKVRVIDLAGIKTRTFLLDSIGVNVTYQ